MRALRVPPGLQVLPERRTRLLARPRKRVLVVLPAPTQAPAVTALVVLVVTVRSLLARAARAAQRFSDRRIRRVPIAAESSALRVACCHRSMRCSAGLGL